ncbi:DUF5335 family protein [Actinoallomurus iriomotensis]|uniref:Uncharacterized protein n=1 Tax=Actinoallomurus iriomotensis TaxID=478107 RepID=A0A9W6SGN5_9ACTN|nr:DUF5335 family protein [Actinoallomurus iriomotensis]GLY92575.1 hypothetical protein Airi02_105030 [Actinoallomurus iriomotensis]
MSQATTVDHGKWAEFFDTLSADHAGHSAAIELLDADFGDQFETERLPFAYASYDPRDDVVVIGVGGNSSRFPVLLRHMIDHPTEIDLTVPEPAETDVRIVGEDGTTTLLRLRPKPALPS